MRNEATGQIVIKIEPMFDVKTENGEDELEIRQEIAAGNRQGPSMELTAQLESLNRDKAKLLSDLLTTREDYDRVCSSLNEKEAELADVKNKYAKLLAEKDLQIQKLYLKCAKKKSNEKEMASNVFNVEKILAHKIVNGQRLFLVRWELFGPEHDTWEPENNFFCKQILNEYKKQNKIFK